MHPVPSEWPKYGVYGESCEDACQRIFPGSTILRYHIEGSLGFVNLTLKQPDGSLLYLRGEPRRNPKDKAKSNAEAGRYYELDQTANPLADPLEMAKVYYYMINHDDLRYAFSMRSSRSQAQTSFEEFQNAWKNNIEVTLEEGSTHVDERSAQVQGQLSSTDDGPDGRVKAVYNCRIRLVREQGEWRYDGGDFEKRGFQEELAARPSETPAPVTEDSADIQAYTSGARGALALAVIAPSLSTRKVANGLLLNLGVSACEPKSASGVLVVVRSGLFRPLDTNYPSYRELMEAAEGQLNIVGENYHIYIFEFQHDLTLSQVLHKSFKAED